MLASVDPAYSTESEIRTKSNILGILSGAAALATAPVILEEASASAKAISLLREAGDVSLKDAATLGLGLSTYALPATLLGASALLLKHQANRAASRPRSEPR